MPAMMLAAALALASVPVNAPSKFADPPVGRTLSGQVTAAAGDPLVDARVLVIEANRSALTGPEGRYQIGNLGNGTYTVSFALLATPRKSGGSQSETPI